MRERENGTRLREALFQNHPTEPSRVNADGRSALNDADVRTLFKLSPNIRRIGTVRVTGRQADFEGTEVALCRQERGHAQPVQLVGIRTLQDEGVRPPLDGAPQGQPVEWCRRKFRRGAEGAAQPRAVGNRLALQARLVFQKVPLQRRIHAAESEVEVALQVVITQAEAGACRACRRSRRGSHD